MKKLFHILAMLAIVLFVGVDVMAADLEVRLKDGSTWRGSSDDYVTVKYRKGRTNITVVGHIVQTGDLFIQVDGKISGVKQVVTIFKSDLVSIRASESTGNVATGDAAATETGGADRQDAITGTTNDASSTDGPGVFFMPLKGDVGIHIREVEIRQLGEEADKYGPNQIIVFEIDTNGGRADISERIADEIFKLRERHRVVAWVRKAISAGCQTALCCNEIYFTVAGTAGANTSWNPGTGQSIKGIRLEQSMAFWADVAKRSGIHPSIARAMKTNSAMCSYDKDPVTGEVTFYADMSGEFILSDADSNLAFNSENALHCGFSKGTADTFEDLAKLLDLPDWNEKSDFGRRAADRWYQTCERAQNDLQRLNREWQLPPPGDAIVQLGHRIKILQEFINIWRRCPNVAELSLPPVGQLERQLKDLRRQLAQANRRR